MTIIGVGIDIVEIDRIDAMIARHGNRFLARVFTEEERGYCSAMRAAGRCYAARFAGKEAISKALGTGIGAAAGWLDLTICRDASGKPMVRLLGAAARYAENAGIGRIFVSLSHSDHYAVAQAVAVGL